MRLSMGQTCVARRRSFSRYCATSDAAISLNSPLPVVAGGWKPIKASLRLMYETNVSVGSEIVGFPEVMGLNLERVAGRGGCLLLLFLLLDELGFAIAFEGLENVGVKERLADII